MPVRKQCMGAGDFEIHLDRDKLPVPRSVTDNLDLDTQAFGHVMVLPARVHVERMTASELLAQSVFTGVYRVQKDRTTLRGAHASIWLGDEDGNGPYRQINGYVGPQTLTTWVNGIGVGLRLIATYITDPGGLLQWTCTEPVTLDCFNFICQFFGVEWRVSDDLNLFVGTTTALYGSADPTVVVTPWWNGTDNLITGLRATIGVEKSVEGFYNEARVQASGGTPDKTSTGVFASFKDGSSSYFGWYRQTFEDGGADGQYLADQLLLASGYPSRLLEVKTDAYCPMGDVACGETIFAHDPMNDVYGVNDQVCYGGQVLPVARCRVYGIDMQLRQGMGVVFRAGDGTITDLSDYVAWETGDSTLDVDRRHLPLSKAVHRTGVDA